MIDLNCDVQQAAPDGLSFYFIEEEIFIKITHIAGNGRAGHLYGELSVECPPNSPKITQQRECLTDGSERRRLIYNLTSLVDRFLRWDALIDYAFATAITYHRRGPDISRVSSSEEITPVRFDVEPFLQADQPTTFYGDGSSGKSYIALIMAVAVRLPWHDNPLGLHVEQSKESGEVVWLDYETSRADFQRRLSRLVTGMDLGELDLNYIHGGNVLADEVGTLAPEINALNPRLIVIDSIGAACAGDLHGSEAPTRFFNALRQLLGTKLLLFHTNKEKELYGNRFFWNFTRSAWEVKKQQSEGDNLISVGLFHRKANETRLFEPAGFELQFDEANLTTIVHKANVEDIPELEKSLPNWKRIVATLRQYSAMSVKELSEELDTTEGTIRDALNKHKNTFTKVGDKWGLLA